LENTEYTELPKLLVEKASPRKNPTIYIFHGYIAFDVNENINEYHGTAPDNRKRTFVYTHDTRFVYQIFNGDAA